MDYKNKCCVVNHSVAAASRGGGQLVPLGHHGAAGAGAVALVGGGDGGAVTRQAGARARPQRQPQVQPRRLQVLHEPVHHLVRVVRRGRDAELLLAARHRGEVDGLDVVAVALEDIEDIVLLHRI